MSYYLMRSGVTTDPADLFLFFTGIAGHTLNHEFGPVTPTTQYYFTITANTSGGQSPPAAIQAVQTSSGMCKDGIIFLYLFNRLPRLIGHVNIGARHI